MSTQERVLPVGDPRVVRETVSSYVVASGALVTRPPQSVPAGDYVARLESGGVGSPSFAVLPYTNDAPAETIILSGTREVTARSPRYVRVATRREAVEYRLHMPATFTGWASQD